MMKLRHKESTLPKVTMKAADRDSDPTLTPNFVCAFCLSPLLPVLKTSPPTTHLRSLQKRLVQILVSFFPRGTEAWTSRDRLPFSLVPREEKGKCASFILVFQDNEEDCSQRCRRQNRPGERILRVPSQLLFKPLRKRVLLKPPRIRPDMSFNVKKTHTHTHKTYEQEDKKSETLLGDRALISPP